MKNPWQTVTNDTVYENPWIKITHRKVINPADEEGIYGVVHFKNLAIGIVVLDRQGYTWLVGQYRYALGQYSWEIPEGGGPMGSDPLDSAKRELKEETGIRAHRWTKLLDLHLSNSVTDEAGVLYLAQELEFGESDPEDTEQLKVRKMPFEEAVQMIEKGEITDALSIMGLLKVKVLLAENKLSI